MLFSLRIERTGLSRQCPKSARHRAHCGPRPEPSSDQDEPRSALHYRCFAWGIRMPNSPDANAWSRDECATAEILEQVKRELSTVGRPDIERARLPAVYSDAAMALRLCERIDECKRWASKAQALASYAKQAKDNEMRVLAGRIQARAIRRCELLLEIETARGSRSDLQPRDGAVPKLTRTAAASEAGLSECQRKIALPVPSVPSERFEMLVEREIPATVTALAQHGTRTATILPFAYDKPRKSIEEVEIERQVGALMSAWQNACHEARLRFMHKLRSQAGRQSCISED